MRIALIEGDYAILRKYSGQSSLAAYLGIVIQRLLIDQRSQTLGRWRPSREDERSGEAGVLLETLLSRDRRSFEEALPARRASGGPEPAERQMRRGPAQSGDSPDVGFVCVHEIPGHGCTTARRRSGRCTRIRRRLVVLNKDPYDEKTELSTACVIFTIHNGNIVYQSPQAPNGCTPPVWPK